jgi:hypothetical protein
MRYDVRYQVGGEEHVEQVDAPDAASAVSIVQTEHARDEGPFELISVTLLEEPGPDDEMTERAEPGDQAQSFDPTK